MAGRPQQFLQITSESVAKLNYLVENILLTDSAGTAEPKIFHHSTHSNNKQQTGSSLSTEITFDLWIDSVIFGLAHFLPLNNQLFLRRCFYWYRPWHHIRPSVITASHWFTHRPSVITASHWFTHRPSVITASHWFTHRITAVSIINSSLT